MGRGKDLTTTELNEIKSLLNEKLTYAEIGELLGRSERSVSNAVQRHHLKDGLKASTTATPKAWESDIVKTTIENTNKPHEVPMPPVAKKEKTLKDFNPRDIIKYMYDLGYRIENNELVCMVKQKVNLKDIING